MSEQNASSIGRSILGIGRRQETPILTWDAIIPGFGIRENRNGTAMFIAKYSFKGKTFYKTICDTRLMNVEQARNLVMRAKMLAKAGISPESFFRLELVNSCQIANKSTSFESFAEYFIEKYAKPFKKSWRKDQQRIALYLLPVWRGRYLDEITKSDVLKLHQEIGKTRPYAANRLTEQIRLMFNQAMVFGFLPENHANPARNIKKFREHSRERFFDSDEIVRLHHAIRRHPDNITKTALLLDFMIGFRSSEIRLLKWSQIDFSNKSIVLADTKSGRPFMQPLPEAALDLLLRLPRRNQYVFPSKLKGGQPIARLDKAWKRICSEANVKNARLHDIRRTVGSYIEHQTGSLVLVGEILNQTTPAVTMIYARRNKTQVRQTLNNHVEFLANLMEEQP